MSQNLFYLLVVICVAVLLKKQVSGEWAFFISVLFVVPSYNRYAFVLPVMLLLSLPELVKRKNLWLKAWYLTSFLQGLYYPVYGAAVCMGFLPLGIWQVLSYARSGELKKDIRKLSFWLGWGFCTIPVIVGDSFFAWHIAAYDCDERADRLCGRHFPVRSGGAGELFLLRAEPVHEAGHLLSVFLPDCAECCMGIRSHCHESGGDTYGKQEMEGGKSGCGMHCPFCRDCYVGFRQFHGDPAGYR